MKNQVREGILERVRFPVLKAIKYGYGLKYEKKLIECKKILRSIAIFGTGRTKKKWYGKIY